jgi:hypothetical protein
LAATGRIGDQPGLLDAHEPALSDLDAPTASPAELAPALLLDTGPLPVPSRSEADELLCIVAWLEEHAEKVRLEAVAGELSEPLPRVPSFVVRGRSVARRTLVRSKVSPTPDLRTPAPTSG